MIGYIYRAIYNVREFFTAATRGKHSIDSEPADQRPIAFVLNLQRAPERRAYAIEHLSSRGIRCEIVEAVDGKSLCFDELKANGTYSSAASKEAFSRDLSLSEIGCTLSHLRAYQHMLEAGVDQALIFEDDLLLIANFLPELSPRMDRLPKDWGILQLTCPSTEFQAIGNGLVQYLGQTNLPVASSAYLISASGAETFLRNAYPIRYPADSLIGRGLRWGIPTYGVDSPLAGQNNVFPSQIYQSTGHVPRALTYLKTVLVRIVSRMGARK